jgi:hypothetical protein
VTSGRNGSFRRVRIAGIAVIVGVFVFVAVVDVFDGLFLGDRYHPDNTFYTLMAGLIVTFLGGEAIGALAGDREKSRRSRDEDDHDGH